MSCYDTVHLSFMYIYMHAVLLFGSVAHNIAISDSYVVVVSSQGLSPHSPMVSIFDAHFRGVKEGI